MILFLLQYNNYYNRIVKKFDTIQEYGEFVIDQAKRDNFNPGDGVDTKIIINYDGKTQPDYVILTEDSGEIASRWFVLDAEFIRKGQYEVTLHRDVIADNYEQIVEAPCFIEKATLDNDDPMIFNNEDMSFNQIKTSEALLKDESDTAWIVGYIPKDSFPEDTVVASSFIDPGQVDIEVEDITQWPLYNYTNLKPDGFKFYMGNANAKYVYTFPHVHKTGRYTNWGMAQMAFDEKGRIANTYFGVPGSPDLDYKQDNRAIKIVTKEPVDKNHFILENYQQGGGNFFAGPGFYVGAFGDGILNKDGYLANVERHSRGGFSAANTAVEEILGVFLDKDPLGAQFKAVNGKTILDKKTNTKYRIKVTESNAAQQLIVGGTLKEKCQFCFQSHPLDFYGNGKMTFSGNGKKPDWCGIELTGTSYTITFEQEEVSIVTTVLGKTNRTHLIDAPYDMFCMPYREGVEIVDGMKKIKNSAFAALSMAIDVAAATGSGNVYDVQLLPYCPLRSIIARQGIDISAVKKNPITSSDGSKIYTYMIWCDVSNFSFDIPYEITVGDAKISNECDMYRLCSPNYGSAFEFSAAKNRGVTCFNVDATYKPFNPYIHINPDFKGLYGNDFNDIRGLVVGGDFSLTQLTSAWANYELTNKNYQNAFDRQIQSMELKNRYQKIADITSAVTGTAIGAGTAGFGANMLKAPIGGAIGAGVVGGVASGIAGAIDVKMNENLRKEEMANMKDQFGYQLENIQAIPYALAKTSALTANNKLYPFVEYYTCTDAEKQALRDKIKYNGMTVMRIGRIRDYIKEQESYIKGRLIRLDDIPEDYHMVSTIASEINQGIFI